MKYKGREIAFKALVGSHNYNLNDESSDKDYKIFVFPSFDDLYENKYFHDANVGEESDYEVHDIRRLAELWMKSNPNYLEVLFSKECDWYEYPLTDFTKGCLYSFMDTFKHRIARMNLPKLWSALFGLGQEKESKMHKSTSGTIHLVEKFGYDTKQAMHAFRAYAMIPYLANSEFNLEHCLWIDNHNRDIFMEIKNGKYPSPVIKQILDSQRTLALGYEEKFKRQPVDHEMHSIIYDFVKQQVQDRLLLLP